MKSKNVCVNEFVTKQPSMEPHTVQEVEHWQNSRKETCDRPSPPFNAPITVCSLCYSGPGWWWGATVSISEPSPFLFGSPLPAGTSLFTSVQLNCLHLLCFLSGIWMTQNPCRMFNRHGISSLSEKILNISWLNMMLAEGFFFFFNGYDLSD